VHTPAAGASLRRFGERAHRPLQRGQALGATRFRVDV
jgi:hypothetical protein